MTNTSASRRILCSFCVILQQIRAFSPPLLLRPSLPCLQARDNDDGLDNERKGFSSNDAASDQVQSLLSTIIERSQQTLNTKQKLANENDTPSSTPAEVNDSLVICETNTASAAIPNAKSIPIVAAPDILPRPTNTGSLYGYNPTLSTTALAHSLWSYILRPHLDTAIDATAGNGQDSFALAQMLFPTSAQQEPTSRSELVCVDIQAQACDNTRQQLAPFLQENNRHKIHIVHASHAPLPLPDDTSSVALVVYNLGFLPSTGSKPDPNSSDDNENSVPTTTTDTTLESLADAALLLRVGGMLSITTYPKTNAQEDATVRAFLTGLALFSSSTQNWRDFVTHMDSSSNKELSTGGTATTATVSPRLYERLEHVWDHGGSRQTWRVHEHKKLGWQEAPILLTATRVK